MSLQIAGLLSTQTTLITLLVIAFLAIAAVLVVAVLANRRLRKSISLLMNEKKTSETCPNANEDHAVIGFTAGRSSSRLVGTGIYVNVDQNKANSDHDAAVYETVANRNSRPEDRLYTTLIP